MDMRISDGGSRYLGTKQLACNIIILIGTINDIYTIRSLNLDQFGSRSLRRPSSGSQSALQSLARSLHWSICRAYDSLYPKGDPGNLETHLHTRSDRPGSTASIIKVRTLVVRPSGLGRRPTSMRPNARGVRAVGPMCMASDFPRLKASRLLGLRGSARAIP